MRILFLLIFSLWTLDSQAAIKKPVTTVADLSVKGKEEDAVRVKTAKVLIADYELIRKDFAQTGKMTEAQIDQWLLDNTAYISKSQLGQDIIKDRASFSRIMSVLNEPDTDAAFQSQALNSEVTINAKDVKKVFRPESYGRAWVKEIPGGGLIDAKGVGALAPRKGPHGNGLATTGEMLREYLFEKMTEKALKAGQAEVSTVGSYAVIDYGFDVLHEDGSRSPAGSVLRQAHSRHPDHLSNTHPAKAYRIESTLRRFGITSAGDSRKPEFELLNLQTAKSGDLIDFGAYLVVDKFDRPAMPYLSHFNFRMEQALGRPLTLRIGSIMDPGSPTFTQPEANSRVPLAQWGSDGNREPDPKFDRMWGRMHEVAEAHRHGHMNTGQIRGEINVYLHQLDERFRHAGPPPKTPWVSIIQRFAEEIDKVPTPGKPWEDALFAISTIEEVSESDLSALRRLIKGPYGSSVQSQAKVIYGKFFADWGKQDPPPWKKIHTLLLSPDEIDRAQGYRVLKKYLSLHPEEITNPKRALIFAKWVAASAMDRSLSFNDSMLSAMSGQTKLAELTLAELEKPANAKRLRQALHGRFDTNVIRTMASMGLSSNHPNLLNVLIDQAQKEEILSRSEALEVLKEIKPLPTDLLRKIKILARTRETTSPKEAGLSKLQALANPESLNPGTRASVDLLEANRIHPGRSASSNCMLSYGTLMLSLSYRKFRPSP